jgi:hypothetical protein
MRLDLEVVLVGDQIACVVLVIVSLKKNRCKAMPVYNFVDM